jgi:hypothetical protein
VAAATVTLIVGLSSSEMAMLAARIHVRRAHRVVGVVVAAVASALGLFWIGVSAAYWFTGDVPAMVTATGHPTNVTGALDLWLVTTFGLWGGVWLARGRRWGYIISAVWAGALGGVGDGPLGRRAREPRAARTVDSDRRGLHGCCDGPHSRRSPPGEGTLGPPHRRRVSRKRGACLA